MALGHKTGGRRKGTPNKITRELRELVVEALDRKGGVDYLMRQADANPGAFLSLVGKILPRQINAETHIVSLEALVVGANMTQLPDVTEVFENGAHGR